MFFIPNTFYVSKYIIKLEVPVMETLKLSDALYISSLTFYILHKIREL
jgi:hypothetical protein